MRYSEGMHSRKGQAMATPVLHDEVNLRQTLKDQMVARMLLQCSVCEERVQYPSQLDSSARCQECQS